MENYKMGSVCRLCLHKYELDLMQNIFEFYPQYFEIDLTEVIYWIFDIEVRAEDPYTKLICYKCLNVVESVGRYRKFFKTNQIFFHERKCPANFEVETGWYNKKDVGTNTDITDSLHCTETAEYNKTKVSTKRVIKDFTSSRRRKRSYKKGIGTNNEVCNEISVKPSVQNTIFSIHNKALDEVDITVSPAISKEVGGQVIAEKPPSMQNSVNKDCINVPKDTLDSITNKSPEHINLQVDIFKNFSLPQVMLPSLEEECLKQGYAKYEDQYYKVNTDSLTIDLEKFNYDSKFYKNFKRTGKYTFKNCAKRKSQTSNIQQYNKKLLENYYYKIPTSALRELMTQSTLKNKDQITNPTLVKTNEVYVSVCEFCSEVFRHKDHLKDHYLKVHGVPTKTIVNPKVEENMKFKKDPQVLYSTDLVNMKDEMDLGCELSEHVSGVTEPNADYKNAINNINCNVTLNSRNGTVATNTGFPQGFIKDIFSDSSNQDHYFKIEVFDDDSKSTTPKSKYNYNSKTYVFNDHAYAMKIENQFQEKMHPDIANILINELKQIKNIREKMEILKKIRYALYNEINNPTIKSSVLALEEKLQI